jgi:hypothetical protein
MFRDGPHLLSALGKVIVKVVAYVDLVIGIP